MGEIWFYFFVNPRLIYILSQSSLHCIQYFVLSKNQIQAPVTPAEWVRYPGGCLKIKILSFPGMGIPVTKIRQSYNHLIFITWIPVPDKTAFILKQDPEISIPSVLLSVWYKTKFGSQNFGYQLWCLFCNRCNVFKNMINVGLIIMW